MKFFFKDPDDRALWAGGLYDQTGGIFKFKKETGSSYKMMRFERIKELEGYSVNS